MSNCARVQATMGAKTFLSTHAIEKRAEMFELTAEIHRIFLVFTKFLF